MPVAQHTQEPNLLFAAAWRAALPGEPPDWDTPYWQAGIDAKRALKITRHIWEATGIELPVNYFVEAPTIREMAARWRAGTATIAAHIVRMRPGTRPGPALFMFPGGGGFLHELTELAHSINIPGPIYGIPGAGFFNGGAPTAAAQAASAAALILQRQPAGPLFLLGYSLGGCTALETARRLRQAGRQVLLILLDTGLSEACWPWPVWLRFIGRKFLRRLRQKLRSAAAPRQVPATPGAPAHRRRGTMLEFRFRNPLHPDFPRSSPYWQPHHPPGYRAARAHAIRMHALYRPARYEGEVVFFRSAEGDIHACPPEKLWPAYLPHAEWHWVPGHHLSMLSGENGRGLAARISQIINQAL